MKKTQLAAAIALAVSGAVLAPNASASDAGSDMVRFTGGWAQADDARGGWGANVGGGALAAAGLVSLGATGDPLVGAELVMKVGISVLVLITISVITVS